MSARPDIRSRLLPGPLSRLGTRGAGSSASKPSRRSHWLPYLLLVSVHLVSSWWMEQPIILADELGYLGNARYLAGAGTLPDLQGAQFYHFGYSLLLVPIFWLLSSPQTLYKAALILNALLMSSLYFPLRSILRVTLGVPPATATWISLTCCLYPPLILFSNFAWSENAFVPLLAAAAVLLERYLGSCRSLDAALFGLATGFLYTTHPRAFPILLIAVATIVAATALRKVPLLSASLGVATLGSIFTLTRWVNEHLLASAWAGGGELSAMRLASRLLPGGHFPSLILRAAGQLLYLSLATHGLFLLGLIATIAFLLRARASNNPNGRPAFPAIATLVFLMASGIAILLGSTSLKVFSLFGRDTLRAANFLFGRYNEGFAVILMAIGLAELWRRGREPTGSGRRWLAVAAGLAFLSALVMYQVETAQNAVGGEVPWVVEAVNIAGIFPLVDQLGMPRLYWVSLAAFASFTALSLLSRFSFRTALVLLVGLFAASAFYLERFNVRPAREANSARLSFVPLITRLGPVETIDYDFAYRDFEVFYGAQFLLPHAEFRRFHSRKGEEPASELVISGKDWPQAERLGAEYAICAAQGNTAVWLLPGRLQSRLPGVAWRDLTLGAEPRFGVEERGFHRPERIDGAWARWTDGAAALKVRLDPRDPPRALDIETVATGRQGARLQLLANRTELWHGWIPEKWSASFDLTTLAPSSSLHIELLSDTLPAGQELSGSGDPRDLGVMLRSIRLRDQRPRSLTSFQGLELGAEPRPGLAESGFYAVEDFEGIRARWTNGAASLRIPVDPEAPPRRIEIEAGCPGRERARLEIVANGVALWSGSIPSRGWSRSFDLEPVPTSEALVIELNSDSFVPAASLEGSRDGRTLGIVVLGIRLIGNDEPGADPTP